MTTETNETAEQALARLDQERAALLQKIEDERAAERPNALKTVLDLVAKHGFNSAEVKLQRPFKKRWPRKVKAVVGEAA